MKIKKFIIDYGECVKCNDCGEVITPKEKDKWVYVYLEVYKDSLVYPRCEDCIDKEYWVDFDCVQVTATSKFEAKRIALQKIEDGELPVVSNIEPVEL